MIDGFEIMMIWPGVYLVMALMVDAPAVQLGIFGSIEEIDEACEQFMQGGCIDRRQRHLH